MTTEPKSTPSGARPFLPFADRFHGALLTGTKYMTCRNRKYGEPGDVVDTPVGPALLAHVERVTLSFVRTHFWRAEGLASPAEFERVWVELHPRAGWDGGHKVWLHEFVITLDIGPEEPEHNEGGRGCCTPEA